MPVTRRSLLAFGGVASSALAAPLAMANNTAKEQFQLGVASYSLRQFSRSLAIKMVKQIGTPYINIKEFHLPYRSTPEELARGRAEFEKAGLKILGGGTINLQKNDESDIRFYFEYAKAAGMPLMVVAPTAQTVPLIEKMAVRYNIKVAIHNHGPEDPHFPTPQSALKLIRNMDPRMGLCIDVGHTTRTGVDVVESIAEAGSRLLDMHMKDLKNLKDRDSQCVVGEGAMPVVAIFKQLRKMNYNGGVMLEYEIEADSPLVGMQRSFAYMRGVLAGLNG
ncbi:MAG: sugar phosphate isomerase/epimerase [Bryobacteraceae bacterium]|nr:sugar phosphate isomerase/epimerase [Bryobacteraceae bacterium]MDW8378934.1 sugar phosphate isomerase/epimerase [Bryobacterales bacterium]